MCVRQMYNPVLKIVIMHELIEFVRKSFVVVDTFLLLLPLCLRFKGLCPCFFIWYSVSFLVACMMS